MEHWPSNIFVEGTGGKQIEAIHSSFAQKRPDSDSKPWLGRRDIKTVLRWARTRNDPRTEGQIPLVKFGFELVKIQVKVLE